MDGTDEGCALVSSGVAPVGLCDSTEGVPLGTSSVDVGLPEG